MKIIYATDIHGNKDRHLKLIEMADKFDVNCIVEGADMLPKGDPMIIRQKEYLEWFEKNIVQKVQVPYLAMLGNDDLKCFDDDFQLIADKNANFHNIAQKLVIIDGYFFFGFNFVKDYPFRLKDRCLTEYGDSGHCVPNFGLPVTSYKMDSGVYGFQDHYNWDCVDLQHSLEYVLDHTYRKQFEGIGKLKNKKIFVCHMPPSDYGLDVCMRGEKVGSKLIKDFIDKKKFTLSLHGHIHESPDVSGVWKVTNKNNTTIVQPGQVEGQLIYCLIDLESDDPFISRNFIDL